MMDKLQKFCVISLTQGGRHADNSIDLQEFMIMPVGAVCFEEGLQMCAEIYKMLRAILEKYDYPTAVGDEGGFAPNLPDAKEALHMIMRAIEKAGYKPKEQIVIALDAAASELYDKERKEYVFPGEAKMHGHRVARSTEEMIDYYSKLITGLGGKVTAYYLDGIAVYNHGVISSFMDNMAAQKNGSFYMIDKASSKRFEGWPLDSLSINKENGKYFVDGSIEESKENIIKDQYEKSVVDFLIKSLHIA